MESKVGRRSNFLHWTIVSVQPEEIVRKIVLSARSLKAIQTFIKVDRKTSLRNLNVALALRFTYESRINNADRADVARFRARISTEALNSCPQITQITRISETSV